METMIIACPECETKIRVPESAAGKKVRCKACEHVFEARLPDAGRVAAAPKKAAPPAKPPAPAPKPQAKKEVPGKKAPPPPAGGGYGLADEDEENSDPYGMTETDLAPRCPQCAAELESEDQIVCINCGLNLKTRELYRPKKVVHKTGGDRFTWLLPGILCALGVVLLIAYWCVHYFVLPPLVWDNWHEVAEKHKSRKAIFEDDKITGWKVMVFHPASTGLLALVFAFFCWKLGKFAFRRLVLEPTPPEEEVR